MNELDLYAKIEPYLEFDEIYNLYQKYYHIIASLDKSSILDVGCGNGIFLHNLQLEKKFGIDLSQNQINKAIALGLDAKVIDICEVDDKYDIVTAIFDVINYIPQNKLKQFFKCVYNVLNKDGVLLFDINSLYGFENIADGSLVIDKDNKFISIDATYKNMSLTTKITLFEKHHQYNCYNKTTNKIIQYYHKNRFLKQLLQQIGFIVEITECYLYSDITDKYIFKAIK